MTAADSRRHKAPARPKRGLPRRPSPSAQLCAKARAAARALIDEAGRHVTAIEPFLKKAKA